MKIHCNYDEILSVKELKPHPKNSNKHSKDQIERLAQILKYQGWRYPIKVSKLSGFITSGHGRLEAAKKIGLESVPVNYQDYDDETQENADLVSDNAIASWAELDLSMINDQVGDLGPDFDVDLLGIKDFVLEPSEKYDEEKEDDVPEAPAEPKAKRGDIYKLGRHRLMCGDATSFEDIDRLTSKQMIDLVVTDPPYNVAVNDEESSSLNSRNRRKDGLKIQNDNMSEDEFFKFLKDVFASYFYKMKEGSSIYVFYADSMTIPFLQSFIESGFHFAQNCIWNKQQFVMTRKDYHYKHEPIIYGWKKGKAHNWFTDRKQSSVWDFDRPFKSELHPTTKPINIIEYAIKNSSRSGDCVLDLFGGSGSTLIASEKTGRTCYMMEIDPKYVDVIIKRWEDFTGQSAELVKEEV